MRGNTYALLLTGSVVLLFTLGLSSRPEQPSPKAEPPPGQPPEQHAKKQPPPPPPSKDPPAQAKAADPVSLDEQTLKDAKLASDGEALLKFFRDRTLSDADKA